MQKIKIGKSPFIISNAQNRLSVPIRLHTHKTEIYQHTHPDLLDVVSKFKNSFEYAMVTTPYLGSDARYENPSVIFSNNLKDWDIGGVSNPLVPPPDGARRSRGPANCDNCFVFDLSKEKFYIYYNLYYRLGVHARAKYLLCRLESDDCIHWSPLEALMELDVVSPSIVYEPEECIFYMWAGKNYQIHLYKSHDGKKWKFVANCAIKQVYEGKNYQAWHLTVIKVGKGYWAFVVMNVSGKHDGQAPTHIFFFRSNDRINWVGYDDPILSPSSSGWDRGGIYRLGALVKNQKLFVVYSGYKTQLNFFLRKRRTWGLGYAEVDIPGLVSREVKSNNVIS